MKLIYGIHEFKDAKKSTNNSDCLTIYKIISGSLYKKKSFILISDYNYNLSLLIPAIINNVQHQKEHNAEGRTITKPKPLYVCTEVTNEHQIASPSKTFYLIRNFLLKHVGGSPPPMIIYMNLKIIAQLVSTITPLRLILLQQMNIANDGRCSWKPLCSYDAYRV